MTYVIRPLTPEARARLDAGPKGRYSPFSATWSATLDLLEREVWHLRIRESFVLMIDVVESDLRLNGELRANARPASPAVAIALDPPGKPSLLFTCGRFNKWQDNVRAIALGMEALRKVERYGIVQADEQYRGWQALPPGTSMPAVQMTVEEAADFIAEHCQHIRLIGEPPVTRAHVFDAVAASYRAAAQTLHPDRGGDPELFKRLIEARDLLLTAAVTP